MPVSLAIVIMTIIVYLDSLIFQHGNADVFFLNKVVKEKRAGIH